jgi:predicted hydrocarbon binding protein
LDALDKALCRAWQLALEDDSDAVDEELGKLLPKLVEAGLIEETGHSPTGFFWAFTKIGVGRVEELGCD